MTQQERAILTVILLLSIFMLPCIGCTALFWLAHHL